MTSHANDYCNCVSAMKAKMLSSANKHPRCRTVSKRTIGVYLIVVLFVFVDNVNGARNNGKCPSACSCNKGHVVFCNNKRLNITPIGFSSTVEELFLFNNNISSILPATLRPLRNLKILDISGNRLSDVALWDGIFTKLSLLENLMLQDNRITRINRGMFLGLNNLARIYLHDNQIELIESGSFDTLPNLIELKLRNNRLSRFPRLNHTPRLRLLDLSSNKLTTLRDMAFSTVNVEHLMLQNNKLTELRTSVFDDTSRLTQLDISNNRLTAVPQIIKSLTSLRSLNISHNKMDVKTIPQDTFTNLKSLKSLYLQAMGLQTLPPRLLPTGTIILNRLDLTENQWDCKCNMRWMPDYMRTFSPAITSPTEVVCSQSSKLRGRVIMELKETDFECTSEEQDNAGNNDVTTPQPLTPSSRSNSFINPCDVFKCGNDGVCYIEDNRPKCRCTKDWAGTLCHVSLTTPPSTLAPSTTTTRTTRRIEPAAPQRKRLMITPGSVKEETVDIIIPIRNRELLLSINEIGDQSSKEFTITPRSNLYTVQNLSPGRSYNICIHLPLDGRRRSSSTRRDTLCGTVKTNGVKAPSKPASKPEITVVPSPKVTTKSSETPIQKQTSIMTTKTDVPLSDPAKDGELRGGKITPQTEPADSSEFSMLYPAVGAGIGAVVVIIVVVMFCICRRQKRLLKLKKGPNTDYSPGSITATDNHHDVEMAPVVHHHHHNHYNAGSIAPASVSKSNQSSPASTMQNGGTPTNAYNPKLSPNKTNNNHAVVQPKSSRSSSRSSGVSQPDTRYTNIQPHVQALNPTKKYEQNGIPNGYNVYRGHEAPQAPARQPHRPLQQRHQNIHQNDDSQAIMPGNNSYYEANDSHLYPVSPLTSPTYTTPSTGSVNYNPIGHNALFQPIQSPLGTSPGESMSGLSHRLSASHALPPPMACLTRNLVIDNMPRYRDGVQVV